MMASVSSFALQGILLPSSAAAGSHGRKLQLKSFANLTTRFELQGKHKRGRVGNKKVSMEGCWTFFAMHGNCRQRMAAGGIVGQTANDLKGVNTGRSTAQETLEILGWSSLCDAVAGFASTAMGKELCHGLTPPSTKEESQALLDETSAALEIDSILGGVLDFGALQSPVVKAGLDRVSKGVVISGKELAAIATLLEVAQAFQHGVASLLQGHKSGRDLFWPIARLVEPMVVHQEFYKLIRSKIDEDGIVKETASAQVRQARIQARTLEQRLQELLNKLVREKSAAEDVQDVIDFDGRLCLIVTVGKASSIPGLLFLRSGTTAYLEPSQAVPLNDKLAEARAEVQSAEYDVLSAIATKLMPHLSDVHFLLQSIVQLDVIAARGKYSSWIGGRKPQFINSSVCMQGYYELDGQGAGNGEFVGTRDKRLLINLRKARHPLLVEQHYHAVRKAKAKLKGKTKLLGRMRARGGSTTANMYPFLAAVEEAAAEVAAVEARAPVPIDVQVSCDTRVVAITGPNTGGKTAAIKAVGLAALMAKVGLYILAMDPVYMPWFDAVFADIGDEQSLGQSLSTFSGHLLRIKTKLIKSPCLQRIMSESTRESLVLLDELGAGTDPTEGAALGMALLESFAADGTGGCLLTLTTTHHGELKTLKYSDHRFENASVEFDEERLTPTYKLLWGIPGNCLHSEDLAAVGVGKLKGRSHALNVARRLGLSSAVLASAQNLYGAASAEVNEVIMKLEQAKLDFDQSWEDSEILTGEIKELYSQLVASAERLYQQTKVLHSQKCEQLAAIAGTAHSTLSAIARKQGPQLPVFVEGEANPIHKNHVSQKNNQRDAVVPGIGKLVYVPKLARDAKVVEVNTTRKEITVQSGFLQIKVGFKEVQ